MEIKEGFWEEKRMILIVSFLYHISIASTVEKMRGKAEVRPG
jgi:hypothetical protein